MSHVPPGNGLNHCPLMPTYGPPSVMFERGDGAYLWDSDGKRYVDFLAGIAVTSLGHANPVVADAVKAQADRLWHVSNLFATEHNWHVATTIDRLITRGDESQTGQVFFANSGAEANEAALKLARRWGGHGRHVVVTTLASFHGRTLATLAATGQPAKWEAFQPLPEGFRHVPWADLDEMERAIDPTVAAVFIEPVQGEGGVNAPSVEYLQGLRQLCDERGVLLMFDEVQTGLARTGEWFGHHHYGVKPDVVTMAKALGNGMPIGACWARLDVAGAFRPGDHATTFGGQPLATSAARATLAEMERIDAPTMAADRARYLSDRLVELDEVVATRGLGLLMAVELAPGINAAEVNVRCMANGLVGNAVTPSALRFTPPITITTDQIDEGVEILRRVLAEEAT